MIAWAIETLVASTVLMLVVLLIRRPVARTFGARVAYALWLLPALRMVMPPLPQPLIETAPIAPLPGLVNAALLGRVPTFSAPTSTTIDWMPIIGAFWAIGALLSLTLFLFAYRRLSDHVHRAGVVTGEAAGIPIIVSPFVEGPLAIGLWRRAIVLPADHSTRYSACELDLAIRHEAAHHHGLDLIANTVALAVRAIHWFNPVAIIAHRAFRADQEMACDARVLANGSSDLRCDYLQTLLKTACAPSTPGVSAMRTGQLKERLRMIGRRQATGRHMLAGGVVTSAIIAFGLGLTASGSAVAQAVADVADQHAAPMLALGGVTIDTVDDPELPAKVSAAHRIKVEAKDRKAASDAVEARADAAEAVAAAHAAQAEAAADAVDAVAVADLAQAEAAEAVSHVSNIRANCDRGVRRSLEANGRTIVICVPDRAEIQKSVLASLRATRASLARDTQMIDVRAEVLRSLDEAIKRIEKDGI